MFPALMTAPAGDFPEEATDTQKKVAAAEAAQVTAHVAQVVADEYKKAANEAVAADPMAETQSVPTLRQVAHEATDSVIDLLRKINAPKE